MPVPNVPRAWATIPEVAIALQMDRQTLRNRAMGGKIPGAFREPGGQHRWRIPGQWICEQLQILREMDELPRGVKIPKERKRRGASDSEEPIKTFVMIWRTDELAEHWAGTEGAAEVIE